MSSGPTIMSKSCLSDSSSDSEIGYPEPINNRKTDLVEFNHIPESPIKELQVLGSNVALAPIGRVVNVTITFVVVQTHSSKVALDSGSVIFLENRYPIGVIHEIFGPVVAPFYVVTRCTTSRVNSDCSENDPTIHNSPQLTNVAVDDVAYFAPDQSQLTIPIFSHQLLQTKGSDASWVGDVEPPPEELEFSDDEQERRYKKSLKRNRVSRKGLHLDIQNVNPQNSIDQPSLLPPNSGSQSNLLDRRLSATPPSSRVFRSTRSRREARIPNQSYGGFDQYITSPSLPPIPFCLPPPQMPPMYTNPFACSPPMQYLIPSYLPLAENQSVIHGNMFPPSPYPLRWTYPGQMSQPNYFPNHGQVSSQPPDQSTYRLQNWSGL